MSENSDTTAVPSPEEKEHRSFWNISNKVVAAIAVAVTLVFAAILTYQVISGTARTTGYLESGNIKITELLAAQVGGGIRFKKTDSIEDAYKELVGAEGSAIASILTFNKDGERISQYQSPDLPPYQPDAMPEIAGRAMKDQQVATATIAGQQVIAAPAFFGKDKGLVGVLVVAWDFGLVNAQLQQEVLTQILIAAIMLVVLLGILFAFVRILISKPLSLITGAMSSLANGNLETEVTGRRRRDEIGNMARAVQVFKDNAQKMERLTAEQREAEARAEDERRKVLLELANTFENSVGDIVHSVLKASQTLQENASSMSSTADETTAQTTTVSNAAQEASHGVQALATTTEELTASIAEISQQVSTASRISRDAVDEAKQTEGTMAGLAEEATKVGDVVTLIQDIAEQTNLLALNATIEAARAGDAGKGFAVVANEVKNLANQTAKATEDISRQVSSIQEISRSAVNAIKAIGATISRIDDVSSGIAAAIEEQSAATSETARNVSQTSNAIAEVADNTVSITEATRESGKAAAAVLDASKGLSGLSERLNEEMDEFLRKVRS